MTAAAIEYVRVHCRGDAVGSLYAIVRRAGSPAAQTDDINNAARAIVALRTLDTFEAASAVGQLREAEGVPPTLKLALEQPLPEGPGCGDDGA